MLNPVGQECARLSNLTLVARASRSIIGKALEIGSETTQIETASYLVLSLCFKEYCHTKNLTIQLLGIEDFEIISCYYNRLVNEHPDRTLLMFASTEIQPILERVGDRIRSIVCNIGSSDLDRVSTKIDSR